MNRSNFIGKIFNKINLICRNKDMTNEIDNFIDDTDSEYESIKDLPQVQKNVILCVWYDSEMCSGGHESYFSYYDSVPHEELEKALLEVSTKEIADNFKEACKIGELDGYEKTDTKYYEFFPSLADYIGKYTEKHEEEILKDR